MTSEEETTFGERFRIRNIHSSGYTPYHALESFSEEWKAREAFIAYFSDKHGFHLNDVINGIKKDRIPAKVISPLYEITSRDHHLMRSFLSDDIVDALMEKLGLPIPKRPREYKKI
ncbi:MAG: hypothetical protein KAT77_03760 [Nanoarchaeota archaeon]|nr:hypothetical protein [Nanoarchaeota archaeon]